MIEFIDEIPGPDFLVYFSVFSVFCIVLGWSLAGRDGSIGYPMPELTNFDPVSIAALRGGWTAAVKTAVFHLWIRKMIKIEGTEEETRISMVGTDHILTDTVEREVADALRWPQKPRDIFNDRGFRDRIEDHLRPRLEELKSAHLTRTPGECTRAALVTLAGVGLIGSVGGIKILLGMERDRPVILLVILVLIALVVFLAGVNPMSKVSRLGRRYLKALKKQFRWVGEALRERRVPNGLDSSIAMAVFGVGMLSVGTNFGAGTTYAEFSAAFPPGKASGGCGGCGGGGCGGGCGGCGGCGG